MAGILHPHLRLIDKIDCQNSPPPGIFHAFAGGRGLLHEELTKSATREEASEAKREDRALYLCAN